MRERRPQPGAIDSTAIICPMQPLEPPDSFFVSAAEGWLELGNSAEARLELAQVSAALQNHPAVLDLRWEVFKTERDWPAANPPGFRASARAGCGTPRLPANPAPS